MSLYLQAISIFFGLFIFLLYTEERMAEYIILNCKWLWVKIQGLWWMINNHPRNPILRLRMEIQYYFIAKALEKELGEKIKRPDFDD